MLEVNFPAGLEFLGCGTWDNTTSSPTSGSTVEYPGAPRLDVSTPDLTTNCPIPVSVTTVNWGGTDVVSIQEWCAYMGGLTGVEPQMLYNDDGILLRSADADTLPADILDNIVVDEARRLVLDEVLASPLFGGQFRQNASRALLMPRTAPGKRTPRAPARRRPPPDRPQVRRFPDRH